MWGIRILALILRFFGLGLSRVLLHPVVAWYFLKAGTGRTASRRYLRRLYGRPQGAIALGRRPGSRDEYRHLYSFAVTSMELFKLWSGPANDFTIEEEGLHHLVQLRDRKVGAILLGAHLGSFAVLRALSQDRGLPVNVVMYRDNAPRFNTVLKELAPNSEFRVIEYDPSV